MMGEVEPVVDVGDKPSAPATLPTGDDIAEATDGVPATGESTFPKVSPTPPPAPAAHAIQVPTGSLNRTIYSASWVAHHARARLEVRPGRGEHHNQRLRHRSPLHHLAGGVLRGRPGVQYRSVTKKRATLKLSGSTKANNSSFKTFRVWQG